MMTSSSGRRPNVLGAMRRNPQGDWTIADVPAVCDELAFAFRWGKGSHAAIQAPGAREILTIPSRRPIKPVYIRMLVRYADHHGGRDDSPL